MGIDMITFTPLSTVENLQDILVSTFNMPMPLNGGWGYGQDTATVITSIDSMSKDQIEHTFAMMRAHLEMQLTLPKEERYGSINVNEVSRKILHVDGKTYESVTYEIKAIKETDYQAFIEEYKAGYETESFDMEDHFRRRKEATLVRTETFWFDIGLINSVK